MTAYRIDHQNVCRDMVSVALCCLSGNNNEGIVFLLARSSDLGAMLRRGRRAKSADGAP